MLSKFLVMWIFFTLTIFNSPQNSNLVTLTLSSIPSGATVTINNERVGVTPLTYQVETGLYSIKFELAGFIPYEKDYLITTDYRINVRLSLNENFIDFPAYAHIRSILNSNQLQIYSEEEGFITIDLDTGEKEENEYPYGWLSDEKMREYLDIPDITENPMRAIAYQSPSGRYIHHLVERDNGELEFVIFDTQTNTQIPTENFAVEQQVDPYIISTGINWSEDETIAIQRGRSTYACDRIIYLEQRDLPDIHCFRTETTTFYGFLSFPTSDNWILAVQNGTDDIILVNIETLEVKLLPYSEVYGARLSPDQSMIYVAHSVGISLLDINTLQEVEFVTDEVSAIWGVYRVSFFATGDYALVRATQGELFETYSLYRLPQ